MKFWTVIPAALMLSACLSHPPPSPAPYRAIGQEPGWTLIIDEQDLTFIPARRAAGPAAKAAGDHRDCRRNLSDARIGVNIVHAPCSDVMSGQGYPDRVQVDVDGRRYEGCGGP